MRPLLFAFLCAILLSSCGDYTYRAMALINEPTAAPDFVLTDQHGRMFQLSEARGTLVLLFFGFTNCPDVCPTTLADLAAVQRNLGADGDSVQIVLVTVDPERDTAERLGRYANVFGPDILALRGTSAELESVYRSFGIVAQRRDLPDSELQYTIDHTSAVLVIDRQGQWVGMFGYGAPVADLTSDVRHLVAQ
ncbi:MAG TPA: SCO family protein [Roseiflexaceae bacterium]|nr:SCO family protein [Roseiflexaceae bacterium]